MSHLQCSPPVLHHRRPRWSRRQQGCSQNPHIPPRSPWTSFVIVVFTAFLGNAEAQQFIIVGAASPATESSIVTIARSPALSRNLASPTLFPRATVSVTAATSIAKVAQASLTAKRMDSASTTRPPATPDPSGTTDPAPVADAAPVNDGMKSSEGTFTFRWDFGVILALVLVCVFSVAVGMIVLRHYLRRRRHRLTMAALANMRGGPGAGPGSRLAAISDAAGRHTMSPSMARAGTGPGGYAGVNGRTITSSRFYNPHHHAYLDGPKPAGKRPLDNSLDVPDMYGTPMPKSANSSLSRSEGNSSSSTTMVPSPSSSSSSSSSPITPLLHTPTTHSHQASPRLPLPAGLTINAGLAQDFGDGCDSFHDRTSTKRQTVHSLQWIPAPSSAIFTPLDMADSNSTIDFFDALQLAPPVPHLPQLALLRVCNSGGSCLSITSDDSAAAPSPLSGSPASSYCSIASSTTARPSSTSSSIASFASMATVGPSSSFASRGRSGLSPALSSVPPMLSRSWSTPTSANPAPFIPPTPRSMSLPMPSASHIFPTGMRGSAPPSLLSTASSGSGSYFGSPQVGPIKATPRTTSLSPIQI